MFEGCMDLRLELASVPPIQSTSRMRLGQSAPTGVDKFFVVLLSVCMFVLHKDGSLGKWSHMYLPLYKEF